MKARADLEGLIGGVGGPGFEAALHKDERKCVGDQTIIVNDQNSLHGDLPLNSLSWSANDVTLHLRPNSACCP